MKASILETTRLILKPISLEHLSQNYVDWLNDPDVYKYLETGGNYSLDKLKEYLVDVVKQDIYFWAIHIKESGLHIGNIKVDPIDYRARVGEMGTMIGDKNFWNKGYGHEAKKCVAEFCFKGLKINKITTGFYADNYKILKINEKMGFIIEGIFKQHKMNKHDGKIHDIVRMALFNPDFINDK